MATEHVQKFDFQEDVSHCKFLIFFGAIKINGIIYLNFVDIWDGSIIIKL